jgi:hypothetical protein
VKIQIKNRWDGSVIFETDAENIGAAVKAAIAAKVALSGADLSCADLSCADLSGADLSGADLSGAKLRGADLNKKELAAILATRTIVPEGDLIVWKKIYKRGKFIICKLKIPADAKRVGGLIGRKCRAEFAIVLDGEGYSSHDNSFEYKVGKTVIPHEFDPNPMVECSGGIHFFLTKEEAEAY